MFKFYKMKLKRIIYASSLAVLLAAGGCKKDKFDINSNPDDVTDVSVTPSVLLPGAQQTTSAIVAADWTFLNMWMGYWARSGSYQSLTEIETYKFTNNFENQVWNDLYANANNYNIMQTKAAASGQGFYDAVGRIMKAHNFHILVDVYNNVPYFDAFKGTVAATPKFDKGVDIYKDLFKQLDTAITLLKGETASAVANPEKAVADLVYAGDNASWIRFANTLRLRMLVHLHNGIAGTQVAPGIDVTEQTAKFNAADFGGFIGAGQSAHLNPGFSGSKPQPFYRFYNTNESGSGSQRDFVRGNEYAIEYYKYNGDPRLNRFYEAPSGSAQTGIKFGTPSGDQDLIGSKLSTVRGPGLSPNGAASRAWILTSVESLFLQAEARERNLITASTAKILLTSAVRESFVWLDAKYPNVRNAANTADSIVYTPTTSADRYIANNESYPDVDYDAAGGGLFTILSQKWFALNSIAPYEIWTDYRRTDYVLGVPVGYDPGPPISVDPANTTTTIPKRLLYPQSEYSYNAANVAAEGTINVFTNKIFWDLN